MSKETAQWLNTNVLIGNTDARGYAWHYRAEEQGEESNHYPGSIPVGDVQRRLFHWEATPRRVAVEVPADLDTMTHLSETGEPVRWLVQDDRQAVVRDDNDYVMGLFKSGYQIHAYDEWLLNNVSTILGDTLGISSAGLLKGGSVAWVEVSVPETLHNDLTGYEYRPNLLAVSSCDGSLATGYHRTVTSTVCDNTMHWALQEVGEQKIKFRHTSKSLAKMTDARAAVGLVETVADAFDASVEALVRMTVTDRQWREFLDAWVPLEDKNREPLTGRSLTMAENKRDGISRQYNRDARADTWRGTALGVVQAVNTYEHHDATVRGDTRANRNMMRAISGDFDKLDAEVFNTLTKVLA